MNKPDDMATQAAEFLKTWQDALARQMNDPATIHAMLSAMNAFNPRGTAHDASPRRPAAAHDDANDAIRDLTRRVAKLERELAGLRQPVPAKAKKPAGTRRRVVAKPKPAAKRPVARRIKSKRRKK